MSEEETTIEEIRAKDVDEERVTLFLMGLLFLLLLLSHMGSQTVFFLRGMFIAGGILLVLILTLIDKWKTTTFTTAITRLLIIFFLFVLWASIRTAFSDVHSEGYKYLGTYIEGFWILLAGFLLAKRLHGKQWIIMVGFLLILLVSLLKAVAQYLWEFEAHLRAFQEIGDMYREQLRYGIEHALREKRIFSFYGNPNIFCGFLAMMLPLSLWGGLNTRFSKPVRAICYILALVVLICAVLTGSRGGLLSLAVTVLIFLSLKKAKIKINRKSIVIALVIIVILSVTAFGALLIWAKGKGSTWQHEIQRWTNINTIKQRVYYQDVAFKMIKESPVIGKGVGSYGLHYGRLKRPAAYESRYAHNFATQTWAELGIIGFILLFAFILGSLITGLRAIRNGAQRLTLAALIASLIAFYISSMVDFTFYYREFFLDSMLIIGLLLAASENEQKEVLPSRAKYVKLFIVVASVMSVVIGCKVIFAHQLAAHYHQNGIDLLREQHVPDSLVWFEKAVHVEPENPAFANVYGNTLIALGDARGGLRMLEKAASLNPYSAAIRSETGMRMLEMGNKEEALKRLEEATRLYPSSALHRYRLARAYAALSRYDDAVKELELALEYCKNDFEQEEYEGYLEELKTLRERR
jgi:O-antigen ligase